MEDRVRVNGNVEKTPSKRRKRSKSKQAKQEGRPNPRVYVPPERDPAHLANLTLDRSLLYALEEIAFHAGSGEVETYLLQLADALYEGAAEMAGQRIRRHIEAARSRTREVC